MSGYLWVTMESRNEGSMSDMTITDSVSEHTAFMSRCSPFPTHRNANGAIAKGWAFFVGFETYPCVGICKNLKINGLAPFRVRERHHLHRVMVKEEKRSRAAC